MPSYVYSLSADFSNQFPLDSFQAQVNSNLGFSETITSIQTDGDVVTIVFSATLSPTELTLLNSLISSFVLPKTQGGKSLILASTDKILCFNYFSTIDTRIYPGNFNVSNISILSYMESGGVNYTVRVYDTLNNKEIGRVTLSNTSLQITDLGTLSNLPSGQGVFETQVLVSNLTYVHIPSVTLYYS